MIDTYFDAIWDLARAAGQAAAENENAKLGPEGQRGSDCGFAWVSLPGNIPFARWAKEQGLASKGYPTGMQIWYSTMHDVPTQSVSVHEAAARAVRDVLSRALQIPTITTVAIETWTER